MDNYIIRVFEGRTKENVPQHFFDMVANDASYKNVAIKMMAEEKGCDPACLRIIHQVELTHDECAAITKAPEPFGMAIHLQGFIKGWRERAKKITKGGGTQN